MQLQKLKGLMTEKRLTVKMLADECEIPYGTLRNKLDGSTKFYVDEVVSMSKVLGIYDDPDKVKEIFLS